MWMSNFRIHRRLAASYRHQRVFLAGDAAHVREQHFALESEQDVRAFFSSYLRQRISLLWPNAEVFQAVLPEMLVNEKLRTL